MNGYGPPSIVVLVTFAFRFRRHCPSSSSWPAPAPSTPTPRTNSFASWKFIVVQRRGLGLMTADVQRNLGWWWLLAPGGKAQRWRWMTNFDGIVSVGNAFTRGDVATVFGQTLCWWTSFWVSSWGLTQFVRSILSVSVYSNKSGDKLYSSHLPLLLFGAFLV